MSGLFAHLAGLFVSPAVGAAPAQRIAEDGATRRQPLVGREAEAGPVPLLEGEAEPGPATPIAWAPPVADGSLPAPATHVFAGDRSPGAPAGERPTRDTPRTVVGRRPPVGAALLGGGADAVAAGAALAGELRARGGRRAALVLVWDPMRQAPDPMPAWPAARNLATTLGAGHVVAARGCIVQVQLPREPEAAAAVAERLSAEKGLATVLVVAGPRTAALDDLLSARDVLVVLDSAGLSGRVAELATAELRRLNARVLVEAPIGGGLRKWAAVAGLGRSRRLGARIEEILR